MSDIPIHKAARQFDFGIFAKVVAPFSLKQPIDYVHCDDYYVFAMIDRGSCCVSIDFNNYRLSEGEIICVQPNQVHRIIDRGNAEAFLLFVDGVFIDASMKQILAEYALSPMPFGIKDVQRSEFKQLLSIILRRIEDGENNESKHIVQNLSCAAIGIITEEIQGAMMQKPKNKRHIEITLAFKELLSREKQIERRVSHYAEWLHISPVYLNEVIKDITGVSVSKYIQNELILRAKRMLVYTSLSIGEVAIGLGMDDCAYFTRLFTKATGINPTSYRKKYLE